MKSAALLLVMVMFISVSLESPPTTARSAQESVEGNLHILPMHTVVRISNNLGDAQNITVYCKSKDDDLGSHVVPVDKSYEWKFKVNVIETAFYFCGFTWQHGSGVYDIYKAERDLDSCPTLCSWKVINNGVHGYGGKDGQEDLYYKWK